MKLSKELRTKLRHIEIHTRRLLSGTHIGDYNSSKKGSGMEFNQIREYHQGDDVRFIDWKGTARANTLLVREYVEQRNRTIMIVVDGSASMACGSSKELKQEIAAQLASVLALVAHYGKDQTGLILFSDQVEKVFTPAHGIQHTHRLMEAVFTHEGKGASSLKDACQRLMHLNRKDAIVFLISDFIDTQAEQALKLISNKFETVALVCRDQREMTFPSCGMLPVYDPETGQSGYLNTRSATVQSLLNQEYEEAIMGLKKAGIDRFVVTPGRPFIGDFIRFCRQRLLY